MSEIRPGQGHPEAPKKNSPEAYVKGAFTTLFCLAISDGLGLINLDQPTEDFRKKYGNVTPRQKLAEITAQATTRPGEGTPAYIQSVKASELWINAAQASLGMFGELLNRSGKPFEIWRKALLTTAGITGNEDKGDVKSKKDTLDKWLRGELAGNTGRQLSETILPVWCTEKGGLSANSVASLDAARELYTKLWDLSLDTGFDFMSQMHSRRS